MTADEAGPAPAPRCHDEVCLTCSDTAIPLRVREILGDGLALVDTDGGAEEISVALVDAKPGDVVLVHAKEAIAIVKEDAVRETP